MSSQEYKIKNRAIDAYVLPKAPCGKPWSGVLPCVFVKANRWKRNSICRETMKRNNLHAIIIGDSFNNTLGLIRSLGEAHVDITLLLEGKEDRLFVSKSRYLKSHQVFHLDNVEDCLPILQKIANGAKDQILICTNDGAVQFIDSHESELSRSYITPMRGGRLGNMMNKDAQCLLAQECGFTIPKSFVYKRGDKFPEGLEYPLLLKPVNSTHGENRISIFVRIIKRLK